MPNLQLGGPNLVPWLMYGGFHCATSVLKNLPFHDLQAQTAYELIFLLEMEVLLDFLTGWLHPTGWLHLTGFTSLFSAIIIQVESGRMIH